MAKDVKKAAATQKKEAKQDAADRAVGSSRPSQPATGAAGSSVAYNLGIHSVLMVLLPFCTFFASNKGFLDPLYERTIGIPKEENKSIIGAVLAVLAVQAVIVSFVFSAFKETPEPAAWEKQD